MPLMGRNVLQPDIIRSDTEPADWGDADKDGQIWIDTDSTPTRQAFLNNQGTAIRI